MIFPIGDDQVKGGYTPLFSYTFILLNILVFVYQVTLGEVQLQGFIFHYGSIPAEIFRGEDYFTLVTSMFLHGGWVHLIGNMLFLWVFADNIEAIIGNVGFMLFYFMGGLAAAGAHTLFNPDSLIPAVGASGAISAVLGAYLVMFPSSRVKVVIIYFFRAFYMPAFFFLGIWIIQQVISGLLALGPASAQSSGVAWWAHIGGFVFGVVSGLVFRKYFQIEIRK